MTFSCLINTGSSPLFEKLGFVMLKSLCRLCLSSLLLLPPPLSVSCRHLSPPLHLHTPVEQQCIIIFIIITIIISIIVLAYLLNRIVALTRAGFLKSILATERIYTVPVFLLLMDLWCVHFSFSSFTDSLCWFKCVEDARRLFFLWGGCEMFLQLSHLLFVMLLLSSQRHYGAALWWKLLSATVSALQVLLSCWVYLSLQSQHI